MKARAMQFATPDWYGQHQSFDGAHVWRPALLHEVGPGGGSLVCVYCGQRPRWWSRRCSGNRPTHRARRGVVRIPV